MCMTYVKITLNILNVSHNSFVHICCFCITRLKSMLNNEKIKGIMITSDLGISHSSLSGERCFSHKWKYLQGTLPIVAQHHSCSLDYSRAQKYLEYQD